MADALHRGSRLSPAVAPTHESSWVNSSPHALDSEPACKGKGSCPATRPRMTPAPHDPWCPPIALPTPTPIIMLTKDMDGFKLLETVGLELDLPVISESSQAD
jgi:hypothetical protein